MKTLWKWIKRLLLWISGAPAESPEDVAAVDESDPRRDGKAAGPPPVVATEAKDSSAGLLGEESTNKEAAVPEDAINDAGAYGVAVEAATVAEGNPYWRAVRVHHLTPAENHGNHHIYLDALDETGSRVFGAQARVSWEGGEQVITVDKPLNEPGTNFPMWKWQVCAVEMMGVPSDRVVNLHTAHPDEPPGTGNTLFHHSFAVDFQRTVQGPPQEGVVAGVVTRGEGYTLVLVRDGEAVDRLVLGPGAEFRFEGLGPGTYWLIVEGTAVRSDPVSLGGNDSVTVNLELPEETGKVVERYVLFGSPRSPRTTVFLSVAQDYLTRRQPAFGFRPEDARHARHVLLVGGLEDLSATTEAELLEAGCQVTRVQGTAAEVAAELESL